MEVDSVHKDAPTGITGFKRMTRYYNYSLAAFGPHTQHTWRGGSIGELSAHGGVGRLCSSSQCGVS